MPPSPVNPPDERLLDAAAAGDREARRALFEQFREAAYRVALRITGREEDALDVVQDAFIKAFDGLAGFQREAGFKTWLLRITTNRALDVLRARKVRLAASLDADGEDEGGGGNSPAERYAPADESPPEAGLERSELAQRLQKAVETLPPDQKSVFSLYAAGEMTYGEIAEAVGIPIGTVMSRLFHARRKLHGLLGDLTPPASRRGNAGETTAGGDEGRRETSRDRSPAAKKAASRSELDRGARPSGSIEDDQPPRSSHSLPAEGGHSPPYADDYADDEPPQSPRDRR